MSKQIQSRGGTTAQHKVFTGAPREVTVDTDKNVVVVHDGVTAGGVPMAKEETLNGAVEAEFTAYGYTKRVPKKDRWLETDTPNVIVDKVGDAVRFSDGLVGRLGPELVTNGDFSDGTTGWVALYSDLQITNGRLKTYANVGTGNGSWGVTQISTVVGKYYKVQFTLSEDTVGNLTYVRVANQEGRPWVSYVSKGYVPSIDNGIITFTFTAKASTTFIKFGSTNTVIGQYCIFDNISVRELPQAELPLAPFDPLSTDELLDYSVNGVTTQIDHVKGDIVVNGNGQELVTNGTFDVDTSGWSSISQSSYNSTGKTLRITSNSNDTSIHYPVVQNLSVIPGIPYEVKASITGTATDIFVNFTNVANGNNGGNAEILRGENAQSIVVFSSNTTSVELYLWTGTSGQYVDFDNISVRAVDDTYQAITNTTAGDLLTDTNKFQTIDYVTRQDVVLVTKTGYKTVKGLHYFGDDVSNDAIASAYQMSKLGNGLYHDGTEEVVISGLVPRLG